MFYSILIMLFRVSYLATSLCLEIGKMIVAFFCLYVCFRKNCSFCVARIGNEFIVGSLQENVNYVNLHN